MGLGKDTAGDESQDCHARGHAEGQLSSMLLMG